MPLLSDSASVQEKANHWLSQADLAPVKGLQWNAWSWERSNLQQVATHTEPPESAAAGQEPGTTGKYVDEELQSSLPANAGSLPPAAVPGQPQTADTASLGSSSHYEWRPTKARVSQADAGRLLAACYIHEDFYDLVDIDSFGRCASLPCPGGVTAGTQCSQLPAGSLFLFVKGSCGSSVGVHTQLSVPYAGPDFQLRALSRAISMMRLRGPGI
jgi:hypothetical protein